MHYNTVANSDEKPRIQGRWKKIIGKSLNILNLFLKPLPQLPSEFRILAYRVSCSNASPGNKVLQNNISYHSDAVRISLIIPFRPAQPLQVMFLPKVGSGHRI